VNSGSMGFFKSLFQGRINRRSLFIGWLVSLVIVVSLFLSILDFIGGKNRFIYPIGYVFYYTFALFIASFMVRRLHDIGKSGFYYLLSLFPIIGSFFFMFGFIYLLLKGGEEKANRYGIKPENRVSY
jgi:uncharacterized membrane protein YhaH (DUF805 family)